MTTAAAKRLMTDLEKNLSDKDYVENICISVDGVCTDLYENCSYFQAEGFTFIWTKEKSYMLNSKTVGRFTIIPYNPSIKVTLKTVL
jgi:hypothetical protein